MRRRRKTEPYPQREIIRWEDPPHSRNWGNVGGRPADSEWNTVAEHLRDEPRRWAVIFEGDRSGANWAKARVMSASAVCFRPLGAFQAAIRSNGEGTWTVFARYMGEES